MAWGSHAWAIFPTALGFFPRTCYISHVLGFVPRDLLYIPRPWLCSHGLVTFPTPWSFFPRTSYISHALEFLPTDLFHFPRPGASSHRRIAFPTVWVLFPRTCYISHGLGFVPTGLLHIPRPVIRIYRQHRVHTVSGTSPPRLTPLLRQAAPWRHRLRLVREASTNVSKDYYGVIQVCKPLTDLRFP